MTYFTFPVQNMATSCAFFTSCCGKFLAEDLLKAFMNKDTLSAEEHILEDIKGYDWHIDTKYYTADIKLCCTNSRTFGNKSFAESVHAFIVYFDAETIETFQKVKSWLPYLKEMTPAVQILVCNRCSQENGIDRLTAQEWCIDNEFELVELSPMDEQDDEGDFKETVGMKRITQALKAHTWPELQMKENPCIHSPYMKQLMEEEAKNKESESELAQNCDATAVGSNEDNNKGKIKNSKTSVDSLLPPEDLALFNAAGVDDPDGGFEKLFENFRLMKEKAESLPLDQRKAYAEKVAISFWKAIGGDSDEIEGLDSEEEDNT